MVHQHRKMVGTSDLHRATTLVCFDCKYTAKAEATELENRRCPTCREPLVDAGTNFKPPKRTNDHGWKGAKAHFLKRELQIAEKIRDPISHSMAGVLSKRVDGVKPRLSIFGDHDEGTVSQMENCLLVGDAAGGSIMADGHLGYAMPVGGVAAYEEDISISGVGFDIACGNMAVRLDVPFSSIKDRIGPILTDVNKHVSFGVGRRNAERVEHPLFDDTDAWKAAGTGHLKKMAEEQLGTVGSGNHYVDLFEDEDGFVWIGVHFGSRGLGHKTATMYLEAAGGQDGMWVDPAVVKAGSNLGEDYIAAMTLAGRYAYAGREWVVERVRKIIGGHATDWVHNHHNYAWREQHHGKDYWVVRKGATPAFPGQRGFVGGSMGDNAVIVSGVENDSDTWYSTVHGAGRVMSRMAAIGKHRSSMRCTGDGCKTEQTIMAYEEARAAAGVKQGQLFNTCVSHPKLPMRKHRERLEGRVRHDDMQEWLHRKGVTLIGGGLDEAPQAYRRLDDVLNVHRGTIMIEHTLRPFGVVMAGADVKDPFKD